MFWPLRGPPRGARYSTLGGKLKIASTILNLQKKGSSMPNLVKIGPAVSQIMGVGKKKGRHIF